MLNFYDDMRIVQHIVQEWIDGIDDLQKGFLNEKLVPLENLQDVMKHITGHVSDRKLLWTNPYFYYSVPFTSYTIQNINSSNFIFVHLKIPFVTTSQIYKIYKVDTYPVPMAYGLDIENEKSENNIASPFTELERTCAADYLFVSGDGTNYMEVSTKLLSTCKYTRENGVRICDIGTHLPKKRNYKTCLFAIFQEKSPYVVGEKCKFAFYNYHNT